MTATFPVRPPHISSSNSKCTTNSRLCIHILLRSIADIKAGRTVGVPPSGRPDYSRSPPTRRRSLSYDRCRTVGSRIFAGQQDNDVPQRKAVMEKLSSDARIQRTVES